jgi:hypothetical protein
MAVGFPAKTSYANGDVFSASDINDTNGTLNLATGAQWAAGKNKIINGDFRIWQRNTTFNVATVGAGYCADRWYYQADVVPTTASITQQTFTPGTAPVAGYEGQFFFRSTITTKGSCNVISISQRIEDVRTFAGQTVTVSLWAKADTAGRILQFPQLVQNFGAGGSASVPTYGTNITLTTSWARYSQTFSVPSITGKTIGTSSYLEFLFQQVAVSGNVIDIWGVQVEQGSTATPFQTSTGTLSGEILACQRYYQKSYNLTDIPGTITLVGQLSWRAGATENFNYIGSYTFNPRMRATPTITFYSPNNGVAGRFYNNVGGNINAASVNSVGESNLVAAINNSSTGATTSNYVHFTAEIEL